VELILIKIPPEISIRATIRFGSVYYFPEESFSSPEPHYFIVINTDPLRDTVVFLICASSQIDNVRARRSTCPSETLVEIRPAQYIGFKVSSIIDCNYVIEKSIDQLIEKLSREELKIKEEMDASLVQQLREGILKSPVVERRIKELLKN